MDNELVTAIATACVAVILSMLTYIKQYIEGKKVKEELTSITQAINDSDTAFYVVCPKCGYKIYLKDVKINKEV